MKSRERTRNWTKTLYSLGIFILLIAAIIVLVQRELEYPRFF